MAHSGKLAHWLTENATALDLRVKDLAWVRSWGLALSDIEVSVEVEGRRFRGRGTAESETLAFVKAGAEAIERAYCAGHGIHSVGVAAHTEEPAAKNNAIKELFERDAFFSHFFTRTPFFPLMQQIQVAKWASAIISRAEAASVSIKFWQARSSFQSVIIAVAEGRRAHPAWGGIVGLGCEETEEAAMGSALIECARNISAILYGDSPSPISFEVFSKILDPTSEDRQHLALDPFYWQQVSHLFQSSHGENLVSISSDQEPIVEKLSNPFRIFNSAPLFVYRARFPNPVRPMDRSPTTLVRLSDFVGRPVTEEQLETLPHFLG